MITPEIRSALAELDPYLNISKTMIFQYQEVEQELEGGVNKKVIFVLATHGIFLYEKNDETFTQVKSMPIFDLMHINSTAETADFSNDTDRIKIKTEDAMTLTLFTYIIRTLQFPIEILPLSTHYPPEYQPHFESTQPYSDDIITDRIISCSFFTKLELNDEILEEITQRIELIDENYEITTDKLDFPYVRQLILGLASEKTISNLFLNSIEISTFLSRCNDLFIYGKFITKIIFISCNFGETLENLKILLQNSHLFMPSQWIFDKCICDQFNFLQFYTKIPEITKSIEYLEFNSCKMEKTTMNDIFSNILFEECYKSLKTIKFLNTNESYNIYDDISNILSSDWVVHNQTINEIDISNCSLDSSTLLIKIVEFDSGLKILRCRRSNAERYVDLRTPTPLKQLSFLDLRHCKISSQNLINLFQIASSGIIYLRGLDLSDLTIFPSIARDIYENLTDMNTFIPSLQCFFYDDNEMNKEELFEFKRFLSLQKNLKFVSLNNTISCKENLKMTTDFFTGLLSIENLESLSIRSNGRMDVTYGDFLAPALDELSKRKMKLLDLTGQQIKSDSLKILTKMINENKIEELYFDDCRPSNYEELLDLCDLVYKNQIKSSFPHRSLHRFFGFFDDVYAVSDNILENHEMIDNMEATFQICYGDPINDDDLIATIRSNEFAATIKDIYQEKEENQEKSRKYLENSLSNPELLTKLNVNPEMEALINECLEGTTREYHILSVLDEIAEKFSIDAILKVAN
ncbi:hypothetical protein TVAG_107730 [Trichomonas vaginalis G3]|uniref:Leucine Rich Repeat family protein n=1 Tax=Trichomonas vaginalis (strain ATCC PRA-98 / G3) TaxID=412133 RepID=A2F0R9_TRIV3|nr:leucine-rich repeat, isoform f-related family [Trichomonas vaginalis G3]EAY01514.1 hypothetical protein TVAG_107730 [Trichomonas vaginalis G3]KAI5482182.1 leucine-rich repeat, isoform f-related family [Trichomonas vaginalis G3]|eukprot:XP_001330286.1 hypothetical protein [Trichomonas vaginalis G3]